jgi:chromosome segregation ATPase
MIEKIAEVNGIIEKLEERVRALADERNAALSDAAGLKKSLDDREMELLQLDEELRSETKRFEAELARLNQEREETEKHFDELASRVRSLLSLLPEYRCEARDE